MSYLSRWILKIVVLSVICAITEEVMPPGGVKRVGKLACGLVIMWEMLTPVVQIQEYLKRDWNSEYELQLEQATQELKERVSWERKNIIENQYAAYIVDKAAQMGVTCTVQVECREGEEGLYFPKNVKIIGEISDVEQSQMMQLLEKELEIPAQQQEYYWKEDTP